MKHKNKLKLLFVNLFFIPVYALAKGPGGLIPCDGVNCTLGDLFTLINTLITFAITHLFFPIFIIAIVYVGFTYLTAGGDTKKVANVKKMAWHLFLGILLVLGAWLIVKSALTVIGAKQDATMFLGDK